MVCRQCGARITKFSRRVACEEVLPESWGREHEAARLTVLDAAVCCSWSCMWAYAATRAREAVAV